MALALASFLCAGPSRAQPSGAARAATVQSPAPLGRRIRLVVVPCPSEAIDTSALAAALSVELVQEGVTAVDVGTRDASEAETAEAEATEAAEVAAGRARTLVELHASPCSAGARALVFSIRPIDAIGVTTTASRLDGRVDLADVADPALRPRVVALAIAEQLRTLWAEPSPVRRDPELAPIHAEAPAAAGPVAPAAARPMPTSPVAPRGRAPSSERRPAGAEVVAAMEGRVSAGMPLMLGPRVELRWPGDRSRLHVRLRADAGITFGGVHDTLGDVALTLATAGLGVALAGGAGAVRAEVGPRIEGGWMGAQGTADHAGVRASNAAAVVGTASLVASGWALFSDAWRGLLEVEVGATFAGLDVRADTRDVAHVTGPAAVVRVGAAYGF